MYNALNEYYEYLFRHWHINLSKEIIKYILKLWHGMDFVHSLPGSHSLAHELGQFLRGDAHARRAWRLPAQLSRRQDEEQQAGTGMADGTP